MKTSNVPNAFMALCLLMVFANRFPIIASNGMLLAFVQIASRGIAYKIINVSSQHFYSIMIHPHQFLQTMDCQVEVIRELKVHR